MPNHRNVTYEAFIRVPTKDEITWIQKNDSNL